MRDWEKLTSHIFNHEGKLSLLKNPPSIHRNQSHWHYNLEGCIKTSMHTPL